MVSIDPRPDLSLTGRELIPAGPFRQWDNADFDGDTALAVNNWTMGWLRRDKDCIALVVAWALLLQSAILSFTLRRCTPRRLPPARPDGSSFAPRRAPSPAGQLPAEPHQQPDLPVLHYCLPPGLRQRRGRHAGGRCAAFPCPLGRRFWSSRRAPTRSRPTTPICSRPSPAPLPSRSLERLAATSSSHRGAMNGASIIQFISSEACRL